MYHHRLAVVLAVTVRSGILGGAQHALGSSPSLYIFISHRDRSICILRQAGVFRGGRGMPWMRSLDATISALPAVVQQSLAYHGIWRSAVVAHAVMGLL